MKKILALLLVFLLLPFSVFAESLGSMYLDLKNSYPEITERLYIGGATDADIERLLAGTEEYIRAKKIPLTAENIDEILNEALSKVLFYSENLPVYNALTKSFTTEAIYYMRNNEIPQTLMPVYNAVKARILSDSTFTTVLKSDFYDVFDCIWADDAISALTALKIVSGYPDGTFRGNTNITRAEFTKLIVMSFSELDETAECDFSDVDPSAWYYKYVATAKKLGIVNGCGNNLFCPNDYITRQDISVIVCNAKFADYEKHEPTFTDSASISDYARTAVGTMQNLEIVNGVGNNLFYPRQLASRAQAAQIIYNAL